eukprot:143715-Rhodomonas_salina.5
MSRSQVSVPSFQPAELRHAWQRRALLRQKKGKEKERKSTSTRVSSQPPKGLDTLGHVWTKRHRKAREKTATSNIQHAPCIPPRADPHPARKREHTTSAHSKNRANRRTHRAVSYTHLTLPTICSV